MTDITAQVSEITEVARLQAKIQNATMEIVLLQADLAVLGARMSIDSNMSFYEANERVLDTAVRCGKIWEMLR